MLDFMQDHWISLLLNYCKTSGKPKNNITVHSRKQCSLYELWSLVTAPRTKGVLHQISMEWSTELPLRNHTSTRSTASCFCLFFLLQRMCNYFLQFFKASTAPAIKQPVILLKKTACFCLLDFESREFPWGIFWHPWLISYKKDSNGCSTF